MVFLTAGFLSFGTIPAGSQTINGAGASFPYPVYSQWSYKYNKLTGVMINYQSIGSGGGIAQIKAKTVDFGASDAPLEKDVLDGGGLMQFPLIMGGVTPVVNIKGVKAGELKLTPELLAGIYLGEIITLCRPTITFNVFICGIILNRINAPAVSIIIYFEN